MIYAAKQTAASIKNLFITIILLYPDNLGKKKRHPIGCLLCVGATYFSGCVGPPSIVGRSELNFRVRNGNGWTLALISTNYEVYCTFKTEQCIIGNQEGLLPA